MPDMNTQTTPVKTIEKTIEKTVPNAPNKDRRSNFEVSFIVPREGPMF